MKVRNHNLIKMKIFPFLALFSFACFAQVPDLLDEDQPRKKVIVVNEINSETEAEFLADVDAAQKDSTEIIVKIDSPGGSSSAGLKMGEALKRSKVPSVCIVEGDAYSAAFFLLQACGRRLAVDSGRLMAHAPYFAQIDHANEKELTDMAAQLRMLTNAYIDLCAKRFKITRAEIAEKINNHDWWMDTAEALKIGALDGLIALENVPASPPKAPPGLPAFLFRR